MHFQMDIDNSVEEALDSADLPQVYALLMAEEVGDRKMLGPGVDAVVLDNGAPRECTDSVKISKLGINFTVADEVGDSMSVVKLPGPGGDAVIFRGPGCKVDAADTEGVDLGENTFVPKLP